MRAALRFTFGVSAIHLLAAILYGDVGIVNGRVVTTDSQGHEVNKTVFTDVFLYRVGRWQAVNAQENAVRTSDQPQ